MSDLERLARAIARGCNLDPDAISPKAAAQGHSIPEWMFFGPAVIALLTELREPSEGMIEALTSIIPSMQGSDYFGDGPRLCPEYSDKSNEDDCAEAVWRRVIDHILAEPER